MGALNVDIDLINADWPKQTPDTTVALEHGDDTIDAERDDNPDTRESFLARINGMNKKLWERYP